MFSNTCTDYIYSKSAAGACSTSVQSWNHHHMPIAPKGSNEILPLLPVTGPECLSFHRCGGGFLVLVPSFAATWSLAILSSYFYLVYSVGLFWWWSRLHSAAHDQSIVSVFSWLLWPCLVLLTPGYPMFFVSIGPNSGQQRENGANQKICQTWVSISLCFHLSLLKSTLSNHHISTARSTALQTHVLSSEYFILFSVPLHHLPPLLQ